MPSASAELQASVRNILAGGDGEVAADPFAERNEWEDSQRRRKSQPEPEEPAESYGADKPRSRRAQ